MYVSCCLHPKIYFKRLYEKVTCTFTQADFLFIVRNTHLDNKGFFNERDVKIAISVMARTRKDERAL
jgi:hypothetical protein